MLLGVPPKNLKQREVVRRFCYRNHNLHKSLSPKTTLTEFDKWWINNREHRDEIIQRQGNVVRRRAGKLLTKLNQIKSRDRLARLLWQYESAESNGDFPQELNKYYPYSTLERDTFNDWFFLAKPKIQEAFPDLNQQQYRY